MSLKDQILATPFAREKRPVHVPQWQGTEGKLYVRNLNALEYERYTDLIAASRRAGYAGCLAAEVAAFVVVDENGSRVFTTADDVAKLAEGPREPLNLVFDEFQSLLESGGDPAKKSGTQM